MLYIESLPDMQGPLVQHNMPEDTSAVHVWLILMKAHQALQRHAVASIESAGLCFSDFVALEVLLHKGPLPVNTIGDKLPLTSGSLTATIDRLERKGLVQRQFSSADRRVRIVHLTPSGEALIQQLFEQHQQDMEAALQRFSHEERLHLNTLLKKAGKLAADSPTKGDHE